MQACKENTEEDTVCYCGSSPCSIKSLELTFESEIHGRLFGEKKNTGSLHLHSRNFLFSLIGNVVPPLPYLLMINNFAEKMELIGL